MRFAGAILAHFRYISRPPSGEFSKEPIEIQLIGMNRHLLALSVVLFSLTAVAQQDPQLTQFYQDRLSFNPAFAGAERLQYVNAFYRDQWNGLETNPKTTLVQYSGRPGFIPGGIGLSFFQDELGQEQNTVMKVAYAYHMDPDANGGILSVGGAINYMGKTLGNEWIYIDEGDAVIPQNEKSGTTIDGDLGVMYRVPGSYYAGISTTRLAATDLKDLNISSVRHLYLQAGYEQALGDGSLRLRSHLLAKTDLNATTVDIHANVLWNDMLYGGLSFRPGDAVAPVLGFEYGTTKNEKLTRSEQVFRFGYSYDATLSELANYSSGSHEIFVSYMFNFERIPMQTRHVNPRFL